MGHEPQRRIPGEHLLARRLDTERPLGPANLMARPPAGGHKSNKAQVLENLRDLGLHAWSG
jgi:hypothetical protein